MSKMIETEKLTMAPAKKGTTLEAKNVVTVVAFITKTLKSITKYNFFKGIFKIGKTFYL